MTTKDDQRRRARYYFHGWGCQTITPSSWRGDCHHFDDCKLYYQKGNVDTGSSVDILYYPAFQQMRINKELLHPVNVPLIGFGGMKVLSLGTISLPVVVGSYPRKINKEVNFLVVDCSSSYNAIIGWPTLNSWRVATSIYHLSVKFPTEYGIGEVQRDQLAARECYLAMLAMASKCRQWPFKRGEC